MRRCISYLTYTLEPLVWQTLVARCFLFCTASILLGSELFLMEPPIPTINGTSERSFPVKVNTCPIGVYAGSKYPQCLLRLLSRRCVPILVQCVLLRRFVEVLLVRQRIVLSIFYLVLSIPSSSANTSIFISSAIAVRL